jgi:hypothetical protein
MDKGVCVCVCVCVCACGRARARARVCVLIIWLFLYMQEGIYISFYFFQNRLTSHGKLHLYIPPDLVRPWQESL